MPGKFGGQSLWLLVSGYNLLSSKVKNIRIKIESLQEETTGAGDTYAEHTPVGLSQAEVAQEGAYFDTNTGFVHDMMAGHPEALTPQSTPRVTCLGQAGMTIGEPFFGVKGDFTHEYEVLSQVGALQRANVAHKVSGDFHSGVILQAITTPLTADGNTEASSVDNTTAPQRVVPITSSSATGELITCAAPHGLVAGDTVLITGHSGSTPALGAEVVATVPSSTTFTIVTNITVGGTGGSLVRGETNGGYAAYLQWTALTLGGHTAASVAVRHSVDDATFADLVVFTNATATRGAEYKTGAGEVRRYLAAATDFTGSGSPSMNLFVGVARL